MGGMCSGAYALDWCLTKLLLNSIFMNDDHFEWDDAKAAANYAKHGVSFRRARLVFADPFGIAEYDDRNEYGKDRFTRIDMVEGTPLFVSYTERGERIRIISARRATKHEQDDYYRQNGQSP